MSNKKDIQEAVAHFTKHEDGVCALTGEVTFNNALLVYEEGKHLIHQLDKLILDCSGITKADSACVALFLEWKKLSQALKKPLTFTHIPQQVQAIVEISGLEKLLLEKTKNG